MLSVLGGLLQLLLLLLLLLLRHALLHDGASGLGKQARVGQSLAAAALAPAAMLLGVSDVAPAQG